MIEIINAHALKGLARLAPLSVQACITSPPYWGLRDYASPAVKWPAVRYSPMAGMKAISIKPWEGELGRERELAAFIGHMVSVFRAVHRVLKDDGTAWVNMGDSYGSGKQLTGQPWRLALALQADGWTLRQDVIWAKPNPMPESAGDRCTKAHEYIFLLAKGPKYFCDMSAIREPVVEDPCGSRKTFRGGGAYTWNQSQANGATIAAATAGNTTTAVLDDPDTLPLPGIDIPAITPPPTVKKPAGWDFGAGGHGSIHREGRTGANALRGQGAERAREGGAANRPGRDMDEAQGDGLTRNKRSVWEVATRGFAGAHFATYPPELIRPCVLASTRPGDLIIDPFAGTGTTGAVALEEGRHAIMIEVNAGSVDLMNGRLKNTTPGLGI